MTQRKPQSGLGVNSRECCTTTCRNNAKRFTPQSFQDMPEPDHHPTPLASPDVSPGFPVSWVKSQSPVLTVGKAAPAAGALQGINRSDVMPFGGVGVPLISHSQPAAGTGGAVAELHHVAPVKDSPHGVGGVNVAFPIEFYQCRLGLFKV